MRHIFLIISDLGSQIKLNTRFLAKNLLENARLRYIRYATN